MNPETSSCLALTSVRLSLSTNSAKLSRSLRYASTLSGRSPFSTRRCVAYSRSSPTSLAPDPVPDFAEGIHPILPSAEPLRQPPEPHSSHPLAPDGVTSSYLRAGY